MQRIVFGRKKCGSGETAFKRRLRLQRERGERVRREHAKVIERVLSVVERLGEFTVVDFGPARKDWDRVQPVISKFWRDGVIERVGKRGNAVLWRKVGWVADKSCPVADKSCPDPLPDPNQVERSYREFRAGLKIVSVDVECGVERRERLAQAFGGAR